MLDNNILPWYHASMKKLTNIRLEERILKDLKIYVCQNNTSIQNLLETFIKKVLSEDKEAKNSVSPSHHSQVLSSLDSSGDFSG